MGRKATLGKERPASDISNDTRYAGAVYRIRLRDGRWIDVRDNESISVVINTNPNNTVRWEEMELDVLDLLRKPLLHTKKGNLRHRGISSKSLVFIQNKKAEDNSEKSFPIDPYTLGVVLGDGRIQQPSCSVELTTHIDDLPTYQSHIPYPWGKGRLDKRNQNTWTQSIRTLGPALRSLGLSVTGKEKFIPEIYFQGSIAQRTALLQGLMDTDGTITKSGRTSFCSKSPRLLDGVIQLARSLGATASTNSKPHNTEIWLNRPLFRLPRKLERQRYDRKDKMVAIVSISQT